MSHVDEGTLHAYLDVALPPGERSQVDAHLAECPDCRERLAEARALIARADALLALALPAERSAPPLHELRRRPLWWRVRWPIAWAATVTLAVGLGWMLRGGENAGQALVASAEQDTLPQTLGLSRFSEEPRQVAQERAPASRAPVRGHPRVTSPQAVVADCALALAAVAALATSSTTTPRSSASAAARG